MNAFIPIILAFTNQSPPDLSKIVPPPEFRPLFEVGRTWTYRYKLRGGLVLRRGREEKYGPVKHEEVERCKVAEVARFPTGLASRVVCDRVKYLQLGTPANEVYRGMGAVYVFTDRGLWRHVARPIKPQGARMPKNEKQLRRLGRGKPYFTYPIVALNKGRKGKGARWMLVESSRVAQSDGTASTGWCREDGEKSGGMHIFHRFCFVPDIGLTRLDMKNDFTTLEIDVTAETSLETTAAPSSAR